MFCRFSRRRQSTTDGFSVLELIVVTAIFILVTGVILANLPKFRNQASLDLTAQEVALAVREAQVYGTATRVAGNTYPSYGLHFKLDENQLAKKFIFFTDNDNNKFYDNSSCGLAGAECLQEFGLDGPFYLLGLKVGSDDFYSNVDIVFTRPFPEPSICAYNDTEPEFCEITNAVIIIGVPGDSETRTITVWNNGQITASRPAETRP